jgi:hypothetical protein
VSRSALAVVRVTMAVLVLVAVGASLWDAAERDGIAAVIDGLSYFTIQSNLIGAAVMLLAAVSRRRSPSALLDWLRGGAVVYLVVTMVVYNVLLSEGRPMTWTGAVVHVVFPLYAVADWLLDPPGGRIGWGRALLWLAYPTAYVAYTFVRGAVVGWYPYPFFDLRVHGAATVAIYTLGLYAIGLLVIVAVSLGGEWRRARRASTAAAVPSGSAQ